MKNIAIGLAVILASGSAMAVDPKYQYCELAGLANGTERYFTGTVAGRLVKRDGLQGDEVCMAVWSSAYKHGVRMNGLAPNELSKDDVYRFARLSGFEDKIADGVIRAAGL